MGDETNRIKEEMEKWENGLLKKTLAKAKERENLPVKRLYTPLDLEGHSYLDKVGFPGQYPFTRGIQPTMYRGRFWTMRMYSGFATAEETNQRYKYLLAQVITGLSVAFDLPTQIGYDSDHPLAEGEVGKVGVAIDSLKDMEDLFEGIPLGKVSTSMTINAPAAVLLAMYQAVAEKQGFKAEELDGTIQNDVLKEYIARGTYIYPPGPSMRLITNIFEYCSKHIPKWNTISLGAYHIREAGSNAAQEIAFAFANAIDYIEAAIKAGLNIDDFAPRISWIFATDINVLEEVAKFRAARRLWAKILKERFGAKDPRSCMLRIHVHTSGSVLTAQQPLNNVVRVTLQALAAVLGGTNSMATCAYDEALALPTEESATLALRTQQILAYESGAADTVDPLAGSYYVEALTDQLQEQAEAYLTKIDAMGGAVKAIEKGYVQSEIQRSAYESQLAVERGQKIIVGVNKFQTHYEPPKNLLKVDPAVRERQIVKLNELKTNRDNARVQTALKTLKECAQGTDNLYPPILEAVKAYATLGEICDTLRDVFGEYTPPQIL
ncbi:MAG: methylmalonyl-CoA mutase family protein [Firmicutes bacterium]|nr:methylmalonyl-CoA mutase family protein [Bacillota bacterium]